ncbi:site-specific DNA-methyltransferase [Hwangdonia sp.]|uniref:site-specific DNA-methyltransferase n=1 Tax=Hwangdonia sp. TaxID=1883432 RepID=UPI003AB5D73C
MAHEKLRPEFTFDDDKINQLKQIVPECFEDGKINFETLRQNLGDWAQHEDDDTLEHFGLFWPGKKEARKLAAIPSEGTLEPVYGEGLRPDGTPDTDGKNDSKNIFIEGENLEVLKILQKSYANRIKMIYIDPPYNTGNDFVYDDDFTEPLQEYLRRTGQIDEEGKPLTTNKRSDGRFHSKWLSMMYPRLRLARNLLTKDGAIFINIDENEVQNLKLILNEIFGEENFLGNVIWKHTEQSKNDEKYFSRQYNYLLCYRKSEELEKFRFPRSKSDNKNYSNPDNDPNGDWRSGDVRSPNYRKTMCFDLKTPSGKIIKAPDKGWRWQLSSIKEKIETGEIIFNEDETKIIRKIYLYKQDGRIPENLWQGPSFGTTRQANSEIKELFNDNVVFDTPKPTQLLKKIQQLFYDDKNFVVLDFFAGSGTTGDAVLNLNKEDGGNRKFILVQFPEKLGSKNVTDEFGFENISDITKQRIKLVVNNMDVKSGFKCFNLVHSNYKKWQDVNSTQISQVELTLDEFANSPLKPDWSKNKLLTEIQLLEGFPLDSKLENSNFGKNEVNQISHEQLETKLLICLDDNIEENLISDLKLDSNTIFICLDTAISNQDKLRLSDKGLIKTI